MKLENAEPLRELLFEYRNAQPDAHPAFLEVIAEIKRLIQSHERKAFAAAEEWAEFDMYKRSEEYND